jgi:ATP-citrate lyase alpha-subunit
VNDAAQYFSEYVHRGHPPQFMVDDMKAKGVYIPGIGHRVKSLRNPDKRVELLKQYARQWFPRTPYLDYALQVEALTTAKRDNLILNVDGCIGVLCCDMLRSIGYPPEQIEDFVGLGTLNAFFVLGRSIGIIGHVMDQKRLRTRLYRQPWDEILFMMPDAPEEVE